MAVSQPPASSSPELRPTNPTPLAAVAFTGLFASFSYLGRKEITVFTPYMGLVLYTYICYNFIVFMANVAHLVRASGCGSEGSGFDPHHSPQEII